MEKPKYDVFISYSRKDASIADKITAAFDNAGITYFIDREGISGGMEFPAVIAKAIRESHIFLFLASKNSYESRFTQSEIVYAFNKKQKQNIIPYIIDGSKMPDELEFTFSAINWRRIEEHPIDTTLVDDIFLKIGKSRKPSEEAEIPSTKPLDINQKNTIKKEGELKKINFTGKHLAIIVLTIAFSSLLLSIIVRGSFVYNHFDTLEFIMVMVFLAVLFMAIIGFIRPSSIGLPKRKDVLKFYLSSFFIMIIAIGILEGKKPAPDNSNVTIEQQGTLQQSEP
jgi:hypothetical protein